MFWPDYIVVLLFAVIVALVIYFGRQQAREFLIRNIGRTTKIEHLQNLVVAYRKGQPVVLSQVAEVDFAARTKRGDAGLNGGPAVILAVQKQPTGDTVTITMLR